MSTIIRWNPMREMAAWQNTMDRLFDEALRGSTENTLALDVNETDKGYTVVANLPGVNADHVNVNLHDGVLTISAETAEEETKEEGRVLIRERRAGKFSRSINLPQPVDADNVEAQFENGVLTLDLPKVPEVQPRQIPVRARG